jgi:hypothetical protein
MRAFLCTLFISAVDVHALTNLISEFFLGSKNRNEDKHVSSMYHYNHYHYRIGNTDHDELVF